MTEWNKSYLTDLRNDGLDPKDFRREMMGEVVFDKRLYDLAAEYHQRCDDFDVMVCGNKEGMPITVDQRRKVNQHAVRVRTELEDRVDELNISRSDLIREIQKQAR